MHRNLAIFIAPWGTTKRSTRIGNGLDADGVKLYCGQMGKNMADRAIQAHLRGDQF